MQTIGYALKDQKKLVHFADQATLRGVSRVIPIGQMNMYSTPWDGLYPMQRLVRAVHLRLTEQ